MPRFAANLSMLFTEVPLLDRFERAAHAGFEAVEMQFPYEAPAAEIRRRLDDHGLVMVLHNFPAGDWAGGDRGLACNPARQAEFRTGVGRAIEYAATLGVPQLNCLAGKPGAGVDEATTRRTFVGNVAYAAEQCAKAGLAVLMEPINNFDVPGFWLNRTAKALDVIDELQLAHVRVQYDIYHAQRYEGEIAATMQQQLAKIGHIQFADNPGRHEPGTGELNFEFLFAHIDRIGYTGWLGAEYKPATTTEAGLGWLRQFSS